MRSIVSRNELKQCRFRNIDAGPGAHDAADKDFTSDSGGVESGLSRRTALYTKLDRSVSQKYPLPCAQRLE